MFVVGGESLIDLVSEPRAPGGPVTMHAHQGGSPYNCAIALAKLGNPTGFLCPISSDAFGSYLLEPLEAAGVTQLLPDRVTAPTTLAVATLNNKREASYAFYRSADRAFPSGGMVEFLPADLEVLQFGGFGPIEATDSEIWLQVVSAAARRGATIAMDPNVRPSLIGDFGAYKARLSRFLDLAHVVKASEEDLELLDPGLSLDAHAEQLLGRDNCELVVITLGDKGSLAFTEGARARAGIWSPPEFGDTVGAGDSLMAGILTALNDRDALRPGPLAALNEQALGDVLRFGAVVAGINCGRKGCNPPTRAEVDAVLAL